MTAPVYPASHMPAPRRLSKSSLLSLICGILGCIPFLTSALAVLFGLIGFVRTGKPGVTGRWMAVVGGILGLAGLVVWSLFIGSFVALVMGVMSLTQPPVDATSNFIRHLASGDTAAAKAIAPGFSDEKIAEIEAYLKAQGTFQDTTFPQRNLRNDEASIEGFATFSTGNLNVEATLEKHGNDWQIQSINIRPAK